MPGAHGLAVLADFLTKGVPGPSAAAALAVARAALAAQDPSHRYAELGFVPLDVAGAAASLTLDYAFDDGVAAVIAELAGDAAQAAVWRARAGSYANVFNPAADQHGAMCPRWANKSFPACPPLDLPPILLNTYYTEGDGLQYTWAVPHDLDGLRALFANDTAYTALLTELMANAVLWPTNALPNPWYWAGNEPSILAPWQFSVLNTEAWRTQYWVRWALDTYYQNVPDGVPGNSDFGTLEAWAVWACLGLYPLAASRNATYVLSSPCFENVTLALPAPAARGAGYAHAAASGGAPVPLLTIVAHNFSASNIYVVRAAINGAPLATPFVDHAALLPPLAAPRAGEDAAAHAARAAAPGASLLEFWLTDEPVVWGTGAAAVAPW